MDHHFHPKPIEQAPMHGHGLSDDSPSSSDNSATRGSHARPNRDPMSHRIIEKRRRDRMNNCLANLSKLVPTAYLKKGRGRVEKTEIIEMAIRYLKHLQDERKVYNPGPASALKPSMKKDASVGADDATPPKASGYKLGFHDCIAETLRFLAAVDGLPVTHDVKNRLVGHLNEYFGTLGAPAEVAEEPLNMSLKRPPADAHNPPPPKRASKAPEGSAGGSGEVGCWSSAYPSSPGSSSRGFSDVSSGASSAPDSPPRVLSPSPPAPHAQGVPIFALHGSGLFYVPLSLPPASLCPSAAAHLSGPRPPPGPTAHHPVTITVHFPSSQPESAMPYPPIPISKEQRQ